MDKRLVGKWQRTDMVETVNIFDVLPLCMKISFPLSGHNNFEPNCVYEKGTYLCYEINCENAIGVYHVRYSFGKLKGFFEYNGKKTRVEYIKLSDTPEDEPYEYRMPFMYLPNTDKTRIEVLKQYSVYDRQRKYGSTDEFVLGGDIPKILEKYKYSEYVQGLNGTGDEIVFRLLDFVCDNFNHNGSIGHGKKPDIKGIIKCCERNGKQTNCRGLSILLSSLIRLNGIKAQHVTCMPYEEPFWDLHVVVDCLLPSGKRIMLDPSFRLYFKDSNGDYVSLSRLRELLLNDEPIFENPTASYNKTGFDKAYYRNYMIKNTFRFARCTLNKNGVDGHMETSRYIELIPCGYPTESFSESRKAYLVFNDTEFWDILDN